MRQKKYLLGLILFISLNVGAQDMKKFNLYKPEENAAKEIEKAVNEAKSAGKHVFIQIGGNWCIWCARFHDFVTKDKSIDSLIQSSYIVYHLNWSKENRNDALMAKYKFPDRFGFPVFLVLDGDGNLIHTQNSAYLEEEQSYSKAKVMEFFRQWTPKALRGTNYQ